MRSSVSVIVITDSGGNQQTVETVATWVLKQRLQFWPSVAASIKGFHVVLAHH